MISKMVYRFSAGIPISEFKSIDTIPFNTVCFLLNTEGQIDIGKITDNGWTTEFGYGGEYESWAKISVGKEQ